MSRRIRHQIIAPAVVLCAACAGTGQSPQASTPVPAAQQSAFDSLYRARTDSAFMRFSKADVDFVHGMIAHHAQALLMSRLAATHGASASIQTLTGRIINAQNDEITLMQQWLRDRKQAVPEVHVDEKTLMVHAGEHGAHAGMPGMLTQDQLRQLDAARGRDFDRLFLTFMIQHHKGAVIMVRDLFNTYGALQGTAMFEIASDIQIDQQTEIDRMELMLAALGGR